jgi:hypothetical protein
MNEPSAVPMPPSSGAPTKPGTDHPWQPPRQHRPIRVMLFSDCRRAAGNPPGCASVQAAEMDSHYAEGHLPVDRVLITRLFLRALQHAGYNTSPQPVGSAARRGNTSSPVVLEGRIWRMQLEERPTPILNVDISLTLSDSSTSMTLWSMDFPEDDLLPFWVGLGCPAEESVAIALGELEAAALVQFSSASFLEAVDGQEAVSEPQPTDAGGSHKVVSASSWTATDEGKITATAYESGSSSNVSESAGEDSQESAAGKRPVPVRLSREAVTPG